MFYVDGISSVSLGVVAEEENLIQRAPIIYDEISIDGRNGSIFKPKNFGNVTGSLTLYITKMSNLDKIINMFTGARTLRFGNRKTKFNFYDSIPVERFGTVKKMTVNYIREPFWISAYDTRIKVNFASGIITNNGNVIAAPIYHLSGSGKVDMTIGNIRFQYIFDSDGCVSIDALEQTESYLEKSKSKNITIGFEYPMLLPGNNKVILHSGKCKMVVERKDRWL